MIRNPKNLEIALCDTMKIGHFIAIIDSDGSALTVERVAYTRWYIYDLCRYRWRTFTKIKVGWFSNLYLYDGDEKIAKVVCRNLRAVIY